MKLRFDRLLPVALVVTITMSFLLLNHSIYAREWFVPLLSSVIATLLFTIFSSVFSVIGRNPTTFTVSLLGFPRSGKSVYLTVLFDELQRGHADGVDFRPYGLESAERVGENLNCLMSGTWLLPTEPGSVFYYRAIASIRGVLRRVYKIEIGDFAGESMQELEPSSDIWLHKTSYFRYVIQSDAIVFAVDLQVLLAGNRQKTEEMQNAFVTALNILIEAKSSSRETVLEVPLALVFMKCDLLTDEFGEQKAIETMSRLFDVCRRRCTRFRHFFASSTGVLEESVPKSVLSPLRVVDPIVWLIRQGRGILDDFIGVSRKNSDFSGSDWKSIEGPSISRYKSNPKK